MSYKIYIVEDHPVMRSMIQTLIDREPDFDVCGAAASGTEALGALPTDPPALFVLDMSLPDISGVELVRRLAEVWPEVPCLILSGHRERSYVDKALAAGARGYVLKGDPREIPHALRAVLGGERFLSPRLSL